MKNLVDVVFVSEWEEGEVATTARLNLKTGSVTNIEISDEGDHYEALIREYVRTVDGSVKADVEPSPDGEYMVMSSDELEDMRTHFNGLL